MNYVLVICGFAWYITVNIAIYWANFSSFEAVVLILGLLVYAVNMPEYVGIIEGEVDFIAIWIQNSIESSDYAPNSAEIWQALLGELIEAKWDIKTLNV